jgi:DNA-binding HxlR family transcriptional regulator
MLQKLVNSIRRIWQRKSWKYYGDEAEVYPYPFQECSFTELWQAVRNNGYPTVSKRTISKHLKRLVTEQILIKLPGTKWRNEARYSLTAKRLEDRDLGVLRILWGQMQRKYPFASPLTNRLLFQGKPFSQP